MRKAANGLAAVFLMCAAAACAPRPAGDFVDVTCLPAAPAEGPTVQLRCAKVPWMAAVHCWLVEYDPGAGGWRRWEVWQTAGEGEGNWGHVRRDLLPPAAGVGDGESWPLAQWTGDDARRLHDVLAAPQKYPHQQLYRYWPGPNSNTYIAWVLRTAGIAHSLPFAAIGKDY